jgi:glyoxylase-like metal-dependent hydrolase (beta-lactamase superfamily II)
MKETKLTNSISLFTSAPKSVEGLGAFSNNILVIYDDNEVLLIDTGYESQMREMMEIFTERNLKIKGIVITHFHDDHHEGLLLLQDTTIPVYGHKIYQTTLDMWTDKNQHKFLKPSVTIDKPLCMTYGKHRLQLIPWAGHSKCTLLVDIDGQYLHVADEIGFTITRESLPPETDDIKAQLDSWARLKEYENYTFIPSHGIPFNNEKLKEEIDKHYCSLKVLYDNGIVNMYEES